MIKLIVLSNDDTAISYAHTHTHIDRTQHVAAVMFNDLRIFSTKKVIIHIACNSIV